MSPVIVATRLSTELFAWLRLHGEEAEHAVPDPFGDAYSVVCAAACAAAGLSTPRQSADETSASADSQAADLARPEDAFMCSAFPPRQRSMITTADLG
jgi:hypothetical protein